MRTTGKRVLVTGGAGFIGSHLADRLVEACNEVVIVDDFSFGKENTAHLEPLYLQEGRPADIDRMHADVGTAERLLGFSADISIEEGLDRYIEWVQRQKFDLESGCRSQRRASLLYGVPKPSSLKSSGSRLSCFPGGCA